MARLEWVILTERTIIEAQSGVVSLMSIVENLNLEPIGITPPAGQKVGVPFRLFINQQWVRSATHRGERVEGRLLLSGPNKNPYATVPFEVNLEATPRARLITQLAGFPHFGAGEYPAVVQVKGGKGWRTVGRTQFTVLIRSEAIPPKRARH